MVVIFAPAASETSVWQELDGLAVEKDGAGAALAFAAAVFGAGEREAVAQDGEQGFVAGRVDGHLCAVDGEGVIAHGQTPCGLAQRIRQ